MRFKTDTTYEGPHPLKANDIGTSKQQKSSPSLLIDINMGPSKTVTININDYDNPHAVAKRFGFVYALDESMVHRLSDLIRQRMTQMNIPLAMESTGTECIEADLRSEGGPQHEAIACNLDQPSTLS